jgi:hypothetical protein
MKEEYEKAIANISRLILMHRSLGMDEEQYPRHSADEMDHYIKTHKSAVNRLRRIREELENIHAERDYLEP